MGKIMITGALGNVGAYVAKYAIQNGNKVVVADIDLELLLKRYGEEAECIRFDFTDAGTYDAALDDVDRVFIMRPPHLGKPQDLKPFIDKLKSKGNIKLVAFLSLIGVENNPIPPHHKIEKYIERAGLPYCHIRPSFFMQNLSGIHAYEIKHFDRIVVPVSNALTSFIDAEDIGEITAKVLSEPDRHRNTGYEITGPEAISYDTVAEILSKELGKKIIYTNPSPLFTQRYWSDVRGMDKKYSKIMGMLYLMTRLGTAKKVTGIFEGIMNKKPRSFSEFAKKNLIAWER